MATVHSKAHSQQVRILVDPGSEVSFISEACVEGLNLQRRHSEINIVGVGGSKSAKTRGVATFELHSNYRPLTATLRAHILPQISTLLPSFQITKKPDWPHLDRLNLADPDFLVPRTVDILVGADAYGQIIKPNIIRHTETTPIAQLSIFGWLVLGPVNVAGLLAPTANGGITSKSDQSLNELLTKFWLQEEPARDNNSQLTPDEEECEAHFKGRHSRDNTGRYVVRLPLKNSPSTLGASYLTAQRCLARTLRRLERDSQYKELYMQFMTIHRPGAHDEGNEHQEDHSRGSTR